METRRSHFPLDPFAILGLDPSMDVDRDQLERRYVELSRATHPDHAGADGEAQADAVRRSAELNDAYRIVKNPWRRAEHLAELAAPGCMEEAKTLPQMFLLEAMELAEEVESASEDAAKDVLRTRIGAEVDRYLERVGDALESGDARKAATLLHEARYYRKALNDLDDPR